MSCLSALRQSVTFHIWSCNHDRVNVCVLKTVRTVTKWKGEERFQRLDEAFLKQGHGTSNKFKLLLYSLVAFCRL